MEGRKVAGLAVGREHWRVEVALDRSTVLLGTAAPVMQEVGKLSARLLGTAAAAAAAAAAAVVLEEVVVVVKIGSRVVALQ